MRFSIRDLLWATVVVAMGLGWWVDRERSDVYVEERVRQWLAKNSSWELSVPLARPRRYPSMDIDQWIVEGNTIPKIEPVLRDLLVKRDPTVDLALVVMALGRLGSSESVPALIDCLSTQEAVWNDKSYGDDDSSRSYSARERAMGAMAGGKFVRWKAVRSLKELQDPRAVGPLGELFRVEPDRNIRADIVEALNKIGGAEVLSYLEIASKDRDRSVAQKATEAIDEVNAALRR